MKRTRDSLRRMSVACWMLFAWAIAAEVDFLPHLSDSALLRWQVTLLLGLVFWVSADHLGELRCRCCGAREVMVRGLWTSSHELLCHRCLQWNPVMESSVPPAPLQ